MQCPEVHELFTDLADNTLTSEQLHAMTDHLLVCPTCVQEWQEFQQTLSLVHGLEQQAPPVDLLPGIHERLAKKGIFHQVRTLVGALEFSLSIPTAATIFTLAMLAGFLLNSSFTNRPSVFQSRLAQTNPLVAQKEILAARRPTLVPHTLFAISHNEVRQRIDLMSSTRSATSPASDNQSHRLLSPDLHILIENIDHDDQVVLCQEMLHRNWQLHRLNSSLFLVHLPQAELGDLHELLGHHRFVLVPAAATKAHFGLGKTVLTAAIRFQ